MIYDVIRDYDSGKIEALIVDLLMCSTDPDGNHSSHTDKYFYKIFNNAFINE